MLDASDGGRRNFLKSALTLTGSALAVELSPATIKAMAAEKADAGQVSSDGLYEPSTLATSMTGEAADRLALRRLVDAWAHCADRRLAAAQAQLFVPEGAVIVYDGDPATHQPAATLKGRDVIQKALAVLNTFTATTHFNGQSDAVIHGEQAVGETYCLAHQLSTEGSQRKLQILSIRYQDRFLKQQHRWFFVERKLITDWSETRFSTP